MDVRWAPLGQNQLGSLRRDGKQFVEKRRRKKREKERKKRKKEKKERKKRKQEERKKGEREEEAFPPLFQIWVDQELILHTSRGEGFVLFGYFLVWGHGNGFVETDFMGIKIWKWHC